MRARVNRRFHIRLDICRQNQFVRGLPPGFWINHGDGRGSAGLRGLYQALCGRRRSRMPGSTTRPTIANARAPARITSVAPSMRFLAGAIGFDFSFNEFRVRFLVSFGFSSFYACTGSRSSRIRR